MLKHFIKNRLKKSVRIHNFFTWLINAYLFVVYKTTRLRCLLPSGYSLKDFDNETKTIFVMWHGMLGLALKVNFNKRIKVLASSHTDGRIISGILSRFGYSIIEGSTNRAPVAATRQIIRALHNGDNIFITPDGPRGPERKLGSNVVGIAKMTGAKIIPLTFTASNFFRLRTWDKLSMPLPFGSITFKLGEPLKLSDNDTLCNLELEERLNGLSE